MKRVRARGSAVNAVIRVPFFFALAGAIVTAAVATRASAQYISAPIDARSMPIGIVELDRAMQLVGVSARPKTVWECHGTYLAACHDAELAARTTIDQLGVDGTHLEGAESVRRAVAAIFTQRQLIDAAILNLVDCIGASAPASERPKFDRLAGELRARAAMAQGLRLGWPNEQMPSMRPVDLISYLDEIPLSDEERVRVSAVVLDAAARREQAGRSMAATALASRVRMGQLADEFGVAELTLEESSEPLRRIRMERMATQGVPMEGGRRLPRSADPTTQLMQLRGCSRESALAAVRLQAELADAVAAVISPDASKRLRRLFRHRVMGLESMFDSDSWSSQRPGTPSVLWTARRILTHPEVHGERRIASLQLLAAWAEAEDAVKERLARSMLANDAPPDPEINLHETPGFDPGRPAVPEIVALAAPYQAKLAALLEMPWISDASMEAPPIAGFSAIPDVSREESALTGRMDSMRRREVTAPYADRPRGWMGLRAIDSDDLEEWRSILVANEGLHASLAALAAAHRLEWSERVDPLVSAAGEMPPQPRPVERGPGHLEVLVEGVDAWAERTVAARGAAMHAALDADRRFLDGLRDVVPRDEQWRVDAIAFRRAASSLLGAELHRVHGGIGWIDSQYLGGRRVDPVQAVIRAGLPPVRTSAALRALVPALVPLTALIEDERRWLVESSIEFARESSMKVPQEQVDGVQAEFERRHLALQRRVLDDFDTWRRLERDAFAAAAGALSAAETVRLDRSAKSMRFPAALGTIETVARISEELRAAALRDAEVERGLQAIAEVDMAEQSLASEVERRTLSTIAVCERPFTEPIESSQTLESLCSDRMRRCRDFAVPGIESARWAWYLSRVLPPETIGGSPSFRRLAVMRGVLQPVMATIAQP